MQVLDADIYDFPHYYDLIYGSDWKAEMDFLLACFQRFPVRPIKTLFEPACGTGRLLFRLGKQGFDVSGNDLNPRAVEYCNHRLAKHGLPTTVEVGDMSDFQLDTPVDAAFNTINTFRHLNSEQLALNHLKCMVSAIGPGGIYVLGLHLTPTIGDACESEAWSASRGHLTANARLWLVSRDMSQRYEEYGMQYDIYTPTRQFSIRDQLRFRTYTAEQFQQLVDQVEGLSIDSVYDFRYDLDQPVQLDASIEDVVFILRVD